jgi:L-iditol 2-dehydrogenase
VRAVVLRDGALAVEELPRPSIADGELLVRMRGCGLCGSDIVKIVAPPRVIPMTPPRPTVLGHEVVADVIEVGDGPTGYVVGDRVVVAHHVPCGSCHYCRRGSPSMCRAFKASNLDPGGFAEYVRVPAGNVRYATFRVPTDLGDEAASFVEPLACCLRAVRRAPIESGDTVLVAGLGSIGCLFVELASRAGARVVGADPLAERTTLAKRLGAEAAAGPDAVRAIVAELSDGRGADQVIVTGGGASVLPWAAGAVRDGGVVHFFAGGDGEALPLALRELYHRELTITATYSSSPADLAEAFRLVSEREVDVEPLVSHRLPLDRLAEGVALMRRHEALKVFVTP